MVKLLRYRLDRGRPSARCTPFGQAPKMIKRLGESDVYDRFRYGTDEALGGVHRRDQVINLMS